MIPGPWVRVAALILTICTLAVSGCASNSPSTPEQDSGPMSLSQDKYVAVEERLLVDCTLINGTYTLPPHITVAEPFIFDGSTNGSNWAEGSGWVNSYTRFGYPTVNDQLRVLLGTSFRRDVAPTDTRTGLKISGVYSYPYTGESGFTIQNVDGNGTVYASYNNTSISLKPGEQCVTLTASEMRSATGTGLHGEPYAYTAYFNTTWTVSNLGIVNKSNLTRSGNSQLATGYNVGY